MKHVLVVLALSVSLASPSLGQEQAQRVLVYGDSNTWGTLQLNENFLSSRLPDNQRFAGVLQQRLGDGYEVVVDGIGSRTTDLDGIGMEETGLVPGDFNGLARLPLAIAREMPLDLIIIMLGTNDLAAAHDRSPKDIAAAAAGLAELAASYTGFATEYPAAQVLLVAPPPVGPSNIPGMDEMMAGAEVKSQQLGQAFAGIEAGDGVTVYDAAQAVGSMAIGDVASSSGVIHMRTQMTYPLGAKWRSESGNVQFSFPSPSDLPPPSISTLGSADVGVDGHDADRRPVRCLV